MSALRDRLYQAIVLDFEGRGEAWTTDDSGDTLARAAAEVVEHELPNLTAQAAADERARIVWWLRAGVDGPAAVNTSPEVLTALLELADVIEQHPERFAQAPVTS